MPITKYYLLDVRTREEWNAQHIDSSHLIPIDELLAGKLPDVPKDTPIFTFCRSGNRSEMARLHLIKQGFIEVKNIKTLQQAEKLISQQLVE